MGNKSSGFNVLIVEDNRFYREALYEALRAQFIFPVLTKAATIQKALEKIAAKPQDVIFLDINLPDGSGLNLLRRLRAEGNKASIHILTSHDLPEYRQEAIRRGAQNCFVKGLTDISEIYAAVEAALAPRFRVLVVAEDGSFRDNMTQLLVRTRPGAVVACTADWEEALDIADGLKPNLVMLRSDPDPEHKLGFRVQLRERCPDQQTKIVFLGATPQAETPLPQLPDGHVVPATHPRRERRSILSTMPTIPIRQSDIYRTHH